MGWIRRFLAAALVGILCAPFPIHGAAWAGTYDPWVHPRTDSYEHGRHYRDDSGELFYLEENDLGTPDDGVVIEVGERTTVSVPIASGLFAKAEETGGTLVPIFLYDRDGDGGVDRGLYGRIVGERIVFDQAELSQIDFPNTYWQLGVRYAAGTRGQQQLDGRYLASLDSTSGAYHISDSRARDEEIAAELSAELPPQTERPVREIPIADPGLVIFKHREHESFDFEDFVRHPASYVEGFDALTRAEDADDWTQVSEEGRLLTHFEREDLFFVRTEGDLDLALRWGDLEVESFLRDVLEVEPNEDGCYSSLDAKLQNEDGTPAEVPHRLLYCPDQDIALFDVPDGYEVQVLALRDGDLYESAKAGNTIRDNLRLYVREVNPRHASRRATGSVRGNIAAGFDDAGRSVKDVAKHLLTGERETSIHTGRTVYRPSPFTAGPRAALRLFRGHPLQAIGQLVEGAESLVQAGADVVSVVDSTVLNALVQSSVGLTATPERADRVGDYVGAFLQAVVKNLPFGERSVGFVDLRSAWYHNRAWEPRRWTRTDTQLNIDRSFTLLDAGVLSLGGGSSDCDACDSIPPLPGDATPETPGAFTPDYL